MRSRNALSARIPRFVHHLVVLAGGQVATKLVGLGAFAVLARRLDPATYGAVEYVVGFAALLSMAVDCGLGTIGLRRVATARQEIPYLASLIPLARLILAAACVPTMVVAAQLFGPREISSGLVWLYALSLVFVALNQEWLLQSAEMMPQVAIAQLLRVLTFAAVAFLLVQGPSDVAYVGAAELVAVAVAGLYYGVVQHFRITPVRVPRAIHAALGLIREGAPLGWSQFAWATAQFMPLLLVGSIGNGAAVAWFAAAQRLVTSISTFSYVYHFNLYPALARASATSVTAYTELMRASFRVTAWLSVGGALLLTLAAAPLLTTIFGPPYIIAAPTLAVLVWAVPVTFLSGHARWSLVVAGNHGSVFFAQVAGLVTVALCGVPLVMLIGEVGAACATVAGAIAVWVTSHTFAMRVRGSPPGLGLAIRPLMLALAAGTAVQFVDGSAVLLAMGGATLYACAAPLLDRALVADLVRLAHAKAATTPT
jgi:O-antigen/teichoic acid export membrane protein